MRTYANTGLTLLVGAIIATFLFDVMGVRPAGSGVARADDGVTFSQIVLDAAGPEGDLYFGMHTKAVGDLNGDGRPDAIVAGATVGQPLVWYAMPDGTKNTISTLGGWSTDAETGDIDNDGDRDVVASSWYRDDKGLEWFENLGGGESWERHPIGSPQAHDLELADLDGDGDLDIVTRQQGGDGNAVEIWRQDGPLAWAHGTVTAGVPVGEGLDLADIDRDGDLDVVLGAAWLENPRDILGGEWTAHILSTAWTEPDTIVATGDINRDGRVDVVLTPSEEAGQRYRISWFEAPSDPAAVSDWIEHIIDPDVEAVMHSLQLNDIDKDGDLDVMTAKMHQGSGSPEVVAYLNAGAGGRGTQWSRQVVAATASHSVRAADFDLDGDIDLFGANWSDDANVYLWRNDQNERLPLDKWQRHVLDDSRPWNAVFIEAGDIDGDGEPDVITGGWWYRNPGSSGGGWVRNTIGSPLNNMAAVYDYDQDGDLDVLGTPWAGSGAAPTFVWAANDGAGRFTIVNNVSAGEGDFLQGVAVGRFAVNGPIETALSWHDGTGQGIQTLETPSDPSSQSWPWQRVSQTDQEEQISAGDIDRDGDLDLLLGTRWLRNDAGSFSTQVLFDTNEQPDRNRLGDVNKDGKLDAIVGFLGISEAAQVAWYEQGADPAAAWTEHVIGTVIGPMSLDVGDIDLDGDLDVVIGEHNLAQPETARVIVFENADDVGTTWAARVVHTGDEHHDGTRLVDIDKDGDLDIVSIGWGHARVLLYQNLAMESGERISGPVPDVPEPPLPPDPEPDGSDGPDGGADDGTDDGTDTPDTTPPPDDDTWAGLCGAGAGSVALTLLILGIRCGDNSARENDAAEPVAPEDSPPSGDGASREALPLIGCGAGAAPAGVLTLLAWGLGWIVRPFRSRVPAPRVRTRFRSADEVTTKPARSITYPSRADTRC